MKKKIFFKSETLSLTRLINCQIKKSHIIYLLSLLKVFLRVLKSARIHSIPQLCNSTINHQYLIHLVIHLELQQDFDLKHNNADHHISELCASLSTFSIDANSNSDQDITSTASSDHFYRDISALISLRIFILSSIEES